MSYLSSYIPTPNATQRSVKTSWAGLNRKQTQDTGELSEAHNISVRELPYLRSERDIDLFHTMPGDIVSIHDTGNGSYVVIIREQEDLGVYYFESGVTSFQDGVFVGMLLDDGEIPSVTAFNVYEGKPEDIVSAKFERRILIYPQCMSFNPEEIAWQNPTDILESFNTSENAVPKLKQVTVLNGRVFGVLDGKFYASEWNSYAGWNLPTSETSSDDVPLLAWVSTTQSDIDASGEFTGITVYGGQVIGFKRNFMHMIYNNKNPFRIVDIAKVGAISQQAICEVNQVLFFVADDGVYAFTGGVPTRISDKLNIPEGKWEGAMLGGDDRTLYCRVNFGGYEYEGEAWSIYTYDTVNGAWGNIQSGYNYKPWAKVNGKCLFSSVDELCERTDYYGVFSFTSDATYGGALVEKKIKRLRLQVVHPTHRENDYIKVSVLKADGAQMAAKEYIPTGECNTVLSMLTRMTCDFGQKIRVEGKGDWEIRYLQIDYESGGEKYV